VKGSRDKTGTRVEIDARSKRKVRQVTDHPSIHHHPFFFVPAYDRAGTKLFFVSHRTGKPQIYYENRAAGEIVQVTDRDDLAEWSIYPSPEGRFVNFVAGTGAWRIDLRDFSETQVADFGAVEMSREGHGRRCHGHLRRCRRMAAGGRFR